MTDSLTAQERADLVLGSPLGREFLCRFLDNLHALDLSEGLGLGGVPGSSRTWRLGSPKPPEPEKRYAGWQEVPLQEVRAYFRRRVSERNWQSVGRLGEQELLIELAQVSSSFGFSGGDDALWGLTQVATEEFRPLALSLVASPATRSWWDAVKREDQRLIEWEGCPAPVGSDLESAVLAGMAEERAENEEGLRRSRPSPGARNVGASWWSAPSFAMNSWTTGGIGQIPTISLADFIDTYRPHEETGATVWKLAISGEAKVHEITQPGDWGDLVARYPRDVTGTHDGEWRSWADVDGPWYLPDWEQVMKEFDGVHVTIGGFVASCGLALPIEQGYTVLAGWIPDATVWLRDVATSRNRLGRWHGNPLDVRSWSDVMEHWQPF